MSDAGTVLDYSLKPFLGADNMPPGEESNAEIRLDKTLQTISAKLDRLLESYGALSNEVQHLAAADVDARDINKRLTVVETQATTNEKWIQRSGENNRWLIALCIGTLVGVLGLAFKVFGHG